MTKIRRTTYQGAYVIEAEEGEGRGFAFIKFDGMNIPAWRSADKCDIQLQSIAAQLRAAGKEVIIEPPA